jgi:hypothetical protein
MLAQAYTQRGYTIAAQPGLHMLSHCERVLSGHHAPIAQKIVTPYAIRVYTKQCRQVRAKSTERGMTSCKSLVIDTCDALGNVVIPDSTAWFVPKMKEYLRGASELLLIHGSATDI